MTSHKPISSTTRLAVSPKVKTS